MGSEIENTFKIQQRKRGRSIIRDRDLDFEKKQVDIALILFLARIVLVR
jgi:hypothetical protein